MLNKKAFLSFLVFTVFLGLSSFPAYSYYYDSMEKVEFHGYDGEGSFVENPAYAGDCFGYVIGILPAALISWPQRIANYNEASDDVGVAILKGTTKPMGLFFGAFPWMLKKAFWDFPIWIGGGDVSGPSPYDYKPAPTPVPEVPPQLQEQPKVQLDEQSATQAQPKLAEVIEPAPLPQTKADIPPIPVGAATDTVKAPEVSPVSPTAPAAQTPAPVSELAPKTWESSNVPEWLNKDLAN